MTPSRVELACPRCKGKLAGRGSALECSSCARTYPVDDGIVDFSEGHYYDNFPGPEVLSESHLAGLANEKEAARIEDYYLSRLAAVADRIGTPGYPLRVLDSGCGNGEAVGVLGAHGIDAWGHDLSALRKWQWRESPDRHRLVVADGASLPFEDASFDAVLASGVLEHIGVEEQGGETYRVRPLPGRDEARRGFLAELARVLAPEGSLFLDFPNGAFPFDFWHGPTPGGARYHSTREGFLPRVAEVRSLCRSIDPRLTVEARSPKGRLRFRQVSAHWYGRAFRPPMMALQRLMSTRAFGFLAGSPLNPYLVLEVRRPPVVIRRNDGTGKSRAV